MWQKQKNAVSRNTIRDYCSKYKNKKPFQVILSTTMFRVDSRRLKLEPQFSFFSSEKEENNLSLKESRLAKSEKKAGVPARVCSLYTLCTLVCFSRGGDGVVHCIPAASPLQFSQAAAVRSAASGSEKHKHLCRFMSAVTVRQPEQSTVHSHEEQHSCVLKEEPGDRTSSHLHSAAGSLKVNRYIPSCTERSSKKWLVALTGSATSKVFSSYFWFGWNLNNECFVVFCFLSSGCINFI